MQDCRGRFDERSRNTEQRKLASRPRSTLYCCKGMSLDSLKKELAALPAKERRHVQAYLVALGDAEDADYGKKLAEKIDKPADQFATLEELDRRLKTGRRAKP